MTGSVVEELVPDTETNTHAPPRRISHRGGELDEHLVERADRRPTGDPRRREVRRRAGTWSASQRPCANGHHQVLGALPDRGGHRDRARSKPHGRVKAMSSSSQPSTPDRAPPGCSRPGRHRTRRSAGRGRRRGAGSPSPAMIPGPSVSRRRCRSPPGRAASAASPSSAALNSSSFCSPMPARKSRPSSPYGATPAITGRRRPARAAGRAVARACGPPPDQPAGDAPVQRRGGRAPGMSRDHVGDRASGVPRRRAVPRPGVGDHPQARTVAAASDIAGIGTTEPGVPWWKSEHPVAARVVDVEGRPSARVDGGHVRDRATRRRPGRPSLMGTGG